MNNSQFSHKEQFDKKAIDSAFKKITENEAKKLTTHFVYAGLYYYFNEQIEDRLRSFILEGMKKYKIKIVMLTRIGMLRRKNIEGEKII